MSSEPQEKPALPPSAIAKFTDHTFTSESGTELAIRVWEAEFVSSSAPFVLHTHGGGFLAAHHYTPPWWLHNGFRKRGYHLVSHSYRLGPQVPLDQQLRDCLQALAWCRLNLPNIVGKEKIDPDRYVLVGDSAGGLFVTLMGLQVAPPLPRAIINIYGVVDIPAIMALERDLIEPWKGEFTEQELRAFLNDRDSANILTAALAWDERNIFSEEELGKLWGAKIEYNRRIRRQAELHMWISTYPKGAYLLVRTMMHPERFEDETALKEYIREVSPLDVLKQRRKEGSSMKYPPVAILHGTGDVSVPVQQSYDLAATLKEIGVPVVECYEDGEPHVFDRKYTVSYPNQCYIHVLIGCLRQDPSVPGWNTYIQPIVDFVDRYTL